MIVQKNYYEVLGVESNINKIELNEIYRTLSIHASNIDSFLNINEAYLILSNDDIRRKYDIGILSNKEAESKNFKRKFSSEKAKDYIMECLKGAKKEALSSYMDLALHLRKDYVFTLEKNKDEFMIEFTKDKFNYVMALEYLKDCQLNNEDRILIFKEIEDYTYCKYKKINAFVKKMVEKITEILMNPNYQIQDKEYAYNFYNIRFSWIFELLNISEEQALVYNEESMLKDCSGNIKNSEKMILEICRIYQNYRRNFSFELPQDAVGMEK